MASVMITGLTEPEGEAERLAHAAGAHRVLYKPASPRGLRAAVEHAVEHVMDWQR